MKYRELLNNITEVAKRHPNINSTFIGDVYELNHRNDVDYCAFVITQGTHRVNSDEDYIDYTLNLFYVDRLTADESNRAQIHSSGIDFMNSLLRAVEKLGVVVVEHTENVFNERFNDVCAGVYATVVFRCEIDECGQTIEIITPDELKVLEVTDNGIYKGLFKEVDVNVQGGGKEPVLETLNVRDNGTYRPNTGVDGFDIVEVNVQEKTFNTKSITKTYTANGQYNIATPDGYDGISDVSVNVNVPERVPVLDSLSVTDNGTYTPSAGVDGYNSVSVNVQKEHHNVTSKSITANGTYNSEGDEVWNEVSVNVPSREPVLESLSVTDNGTYTPSAGVDGYNSVDVNLQLGAITNLYDLRFKDGITNINTTEYNSVIWTAMENLFKDCVNLTSLNLSGWVTRMAVNMSGMFNGCVNLESLNLSGWNTSKVTDMLNMFHRCEKLKTLDVSHFDTSKVTDMRQMFKDCQALTSLDLSHFDVSNVTLVNQIFNNCYSLKSLNISNWIMSKVTDMFGMFYGCVELETIVCDGLQLPDINMSDIYLNSCSKLTVDSIVGLLNSLPQSTHNYSFQIGQTNIDKLSEEQKAIATNKNWRLV